MAQISPKACLLMLFIIFQLSGTSETASADQSPLAISAAVLLGRSTSNSAQLARLADQAINSNRIPIGSNRLMDLPNPLRENAERLKAEETCPESLTGNLLDKKYQAIQQRLKNTNQRIQSALKPIEKLVQQKFEEAICDFCTQKIVPQINSIDIQFRSMLSNAWEQAAAPDIEDLPPSRSIKASPDFRYSAKLENVQLVLLPAASCDDYWQYYQDCDRWGVTFSELEIATQRANELKIASKPMKVKTIQVGHQVLKKATELEPSVLQQNKFLVKKMSRLANDFIVDSKKFARATAATADRLSSSVHQWAAVLEFQAVETLATDYLLLQPSNTPKTRVANQFDLIALGVGCISRAIKHSEGIDESDSKDSASNPLLNSPALEISE
ncbi:hypothetical protein OAU26_04300 [Mariniblastus sp.]|nr:hypothetical protein [Mariniblastus sp.]